MKKIFPLIVLLFFFSSCKKGGKENERTECPEPISPCNIVQTYTNNAAKVTITNGIWGTIASQEGNCMPMIGPNSTCKTCAVKRTVQIYAYTTTANAVASPNSTIFFNSFSTQLIKQVDTDDFGFFQTDLPAGNYTLVVIENGKLYANSTDGVGGLNPFSFANGVKNINLTMTYKAVF